MAYALRTLFNTANEGTLHDICLARMYLRVDAMFICVFPSQSYFHLGEFKYGIYPKIHERSMMKFISKIKFISN